MIGTNLFRKYFLVSAVIVLIFIFLGFQSSKLLTKLTASTAPNFEDRHSVFYAKLIDRLSSGDRTKALMEIEKLNDRTPLRFEILGADGKVLYPYGQSLPFDWASVKKPPAPYTPEVQTEEDPSSSGAVTMRTLIRFSGEPTQYLFVTVRRDRVPGRGHPIFIVSIASLVVSVLLGIALSLTLLYRSLREKAALADSVLAELQKGNLKARFPITKMDEIGQAMNRFNKMAEEIERLVEQLRSIEKSRMTLLQELAHDLRTPVASLKNLLETTSRGGSAIEEKLREELLQLALKEVDYFERLVEDLLVLAQISEPRYHAERRPISLNNLLEDEAESVAASEEKGIAVKKRLPENPVEIQGDPHLLRRMIRNALKNAISFAKSEVRLTLDSDSNSLRIEILDDGPGFSKDALAAFGERRVSRMLDADQNGRLSVGLGSVIIKTVAQLHRGNIEAGNRPEGGARVVITLPQTRT